MLFSRFLYNCHTTTQLDDMAGKKKKNSNADLRTRLIFIVAIIKESTKLNYLYDNYPLLFF